MSSPKQNRIPRQLRARETQAKIRRAAVRMIAKHGRDSFTTGQIAENAGVAIGTVYQYYRSRVDILDELYPYRSEGLGDIFPPEPLDVVVEKPTSH